MKLMKNKKYLQQKFSRNVLVPETTADFTSRICKSYVPFTCKFPMVMHFVPILPRWCRSKTNFYVFSYDKASLKCCASFRFFLAIFMEKFQKIHYLNYVRRGIVGNLCLAQKETNNLHTDVSSHSYVWTPMRFTHHRYYSYLETKSHGYNRTCKSIMIQLNIQI